MFYKELRKDVTNKTDKKWLKKVNPEYATAIRVVKINDLKKCIIKKMQQKMLDNIIMYNVRRNDKKIKKSNL